MDVQGQGCDECDGTEYKGRTGIYELLFIDENLQHLIFNNVSSQEIRTLARKNGFKLMVEDALEKVNLDGTSLDEIIRVIPYRHIHASLAEVIT